MRQVRRAGRATVVTALAGMCVFAGCANSHGAADAHSPTSSTSATSATTITSPVESAVLAAYRCRVGRVRAGPLDSESLRSSPPSDDGRSAASGGEGELAGRPAARDRGAGHIRSASEDNCVVGNNGDDRGLCVQHGRVGVRGDRQAGAAGDATGERWRPGHPRDVRFDVEGFQAECHGWIMRSRLVIFVAAQVSVVFALTGMGQAWAADPGGQNTWANAQASGGQLTSKPELPAGRPRLIRHGLHRPTATRLRERRTRTSPTGAPIPTAGHRPPRRSEWEVLNRASGCSPIALAPGSSTRCRLSG